MSARFAGRVAVVTGAASGIGRSVALRLAREGAAIAAWDRDAAALDALARDVRALGATCDAAAVDITDDAAVARAVADLVARRGRLDALVHCAGIVGPTSTPIGSVSVEDFERVLRVNLVGSFVVTKHAVAAMLPRRSGRVLLFASIAGKEGNPGMCPYSAAKAGVIGLAKSVGKEVAESGVTVNAIAPAVIRTPLVDAVDPRQVEYMTAKIPMRRTGTLDEAAAMAAWIVSDECSFTTGFCFDLSGGRATY